MTGCQPKIELTFNSRTAFHRADKFLIRRPSPRFRGRQFRAGCSVDRAPVFQQLGEVLRSLFASLGAVLHFAWKSVDVCSRQKSAPPVVRRRGPTDWCTGPASACEPAKRSGRGLPRMTFHRSVTAIGLKRLLSAARQLCRRMPDRAAERARAMDPLERWIRSGGRGAIRRRRRPARRAHGRSARRGDRRGQRISCTCAAAIDRERRARRIALRRSGAAPRAGGSPGTTARRASLGPGAVACEKIRGREVPGSGASAVNRRKH
jgi:hypothetical protein